MATPKVEEISQQEFDNMVANGERAYTAEEFRQAYISLCNQTGFQVLGNPSWLMTNHGTFEMVINMEVVPLKK